MSDCTCSVAHEFEKEIGIIVALRLAQLMLPPHAAAVPWVAKRWLSMRMLSLDLTIQMDKPLNKALLQSSLGSLDELRLFCEDESCLVVTGWLLKEASRRLRALEIVSSRLTCIALPQLSRLEHLMLEQRCEDRLGPLCEALPQMQQLRTLHLRSRSTYPRSPGSLKLQLSSLRHLRKASLVNYVPARLQLPPDCELHVRLNNYESAHAPVWRDVANFITIFEWSNDSIVEELPSFMRAARRLRILHICTGRGHAGSLYSPLSLAPAAHVDWLCIIGNMVLVEVPRRQEWGFFGIIAQGRMGVCFKDVASFSSQLPEFFLEFGSMEGSDMLDLAEMALFAGGTADRSRVAFRRYDDHSQGGNRHVISYPSSEPPRLADLKEGFCACGACRSCLLDARRINGLV